MAKAIHSTDFTQGSILSGVDWGVDGEAPLGVVLSNPCDLEHGKASFVLIAAIKRAADIIHNLKEFRNVTAGIDVAVELSNTKMEKIGPVYASIIHNVNVVRYFFIDTSSLWTEKYCLVDFQRTLTIPIDQKEELNVEGLIESPDREKMMVHYAGYVSRIGVDRIDGRATNLICKDMAGEIFKLKPDADFKFKGEA